jgi:hypothetical protein
VTQSTLIGSKRAVFSGCARDCGRNIQSVLANVTRLASLFAEAGYVFFENDSSDTTRSVLEQWGAGRDHFHLSGADGLAAIMPARTMRLALARNENLKTVRGTPLKDFDYFVVCDCDSVNEQEISAEAFTRAVDFLEADKKRAGVFVNQDGPYFDVWALRHSKLCPNDVWEETLDYAISHGVSDEQAYDAVFSKYQIAFPIDAEPIEVNSAFGGLAIYKMRYALKGQYDGHRTKVMRQGGRHIRLTMQVCEHVKFHKGIREAGGRLHIVPWLINMTLNEPAPINHSYFRRLVIGMD